MIRCALWRQIGKCRKFVTIRSVVAEIADRTADDDLINDHLDDSTLLCSQQHKQNGHVIKKGIGNIINE